MERQKSSKVDNGNFFIFLGIFGKFLFLRKSKGKNCRKWENRKQKSKIFTPLVNAPLYMSLHTLFPHRACTKTRSSRNFFFLFRCRPQKKSHLDKRLRHSWWLRGEHVRTHCHLLPLKKRPRQNSTAAIQTDDAGRSSIAKHWFSCSLMHVCVGVVVKVNHNKLYMYSINTLRKHLSFVHIYS